MFILSNSFHKSLLLILFFVCASNIVNAQTDGLPVVHWSPGGFFDTVIDGAGSKYSLGQISTNDTIRAIANGYGLTAGGGGSFAPAGGGGSFAPLSASGGAPSLVVASCSSGYFKLYLEDGSGFEHAMDATSPDYALHSARLSVLCQVFSDIASFLPLPATASPDMKVNIWVRSAITSGPAGTGQPFFLTPIYNYLISGVVDNAAWIAINSGRDPFSVAGSPVVSSGGGSIGGSNFHASIKFNFSVPWNLDLGSAPSGAQQDLYTVALHEIMHTLGFSSLINNDGASILGFGYSYFSRYDLHLKTHLGSSLLTQASSAGDCSMYSWQFNPTVSPATLLGSSCSSAPDHTNASSAVKYVGSVIQDVYTPNCFKFGSSLSHFEDELLPAGHPFLISRPSTFDPNNQYFVMSNQAPLPPYNASTNPGVMKRYPTPEERSVLSDIGYRVNSKFGTPPVAGYPNGPNLNYKDYGGTVSGTQVAGINDGISGLTYVYSTTPSVPVVINGGSAGSILSNDNVGPGGKFKCLEYIPASGSDFAVTGGELDVHEGDASTLVHFTPTASASGVQLLRYIPVNAAGVAGNITYVYVYVKNSSCSSNPCDYVPNGGFEHTTMGTSSVFHNGLNCWEPYSGSPDLFTRCGAYSTYTIPTLRSLPARGTDVHPYSDMPNDRFAGFFSGPDDAGGVFYKTEGMKTALPTPLTPGTYHISFWAKLTAPSSAPPYIAKYQFSTSDITPLAAVSDYFLGLPSSLTPLATFQLVQNDYDWHYYEKVVTFTGTASTLVFMGAPWEDNDAYHYSFFDDISIKRSSDVCNFVLPATIDLCSAPGTIDLNAAVDIPGGTFSWSTMPVSITGEPTITHDPAFDPVRAYKASIESGNHGSVTVCYNYDNAGCNHTVCQTINITPPVPFSVSADYVCPGSTVTISVPGTDTYTWTSGTTCVGGACDIVTVAPSSTSIYAVTSSSTGCSSEVKVHVKGAEQIFGRASVCIGNSIDLHTTIPGTWNSSNTTVASLFSSTAGSVTGVSAGTATISFTASICGISTVSTQEVAVTPGLPAITGASTVCEGSSITLSDAAAGGTWSYLAFSAAGLGSTVSVDPVTGVVTGVTAGTAVISYTTDCEACHATYQVTVFARPTINYAIPGETCMGSSISLEATPTGGTWTSSNTAVATVGGSSGLVTGLSPGTAVITYTTSCGFATRIVTISPSSTPSIIGISTICASSVTTLSTTLSGGTWSSGNIAIASVGVYTGVLTGVSEGTATITYAIEPHCLATKLIVVNPQPGPITGSLSMCLSSTTTLTNATSGGTWSSSNTSVATISATGLVSSVGVGTSIVSYTLATGCSTTAVVTVNSFPTFIIGSYSSCQGTTSTFSNSTPGGTWSSTNTLVATINSSSGVITGVSAGTTSIVYTTPCGSVNAVVTVSAPPSPITGTLSVCAGSATTLSNTVPLGTWSSDNISIATIGATTGVVTGVTSGTVMVTYTLPCGYVTATVTVNPIPAAISGTLHACAGLSLTLTSATAGGAWSSGTPSVATIIASSGAVTGAVSGTAMISYTLPTSCFATAIFTVDPMPAAGPIGSSGTLPLRVCIGSTITLTDPVAGGAWSSLSTSTATIDGASGILTGITAGTVTIAYMVTNSCGMAFTMAEVTVDPLPAAISGTLSACPGSTCTLSDAISGGTWTSSNPTVASVGASSGIVTAISAGSVTITYALSSTGCFVTATFTVNPLPAVISGTGSVCIGGTSTLTDATSGGNWSSSNPAIAAVGVGTGVVTGISSGAATITYSLGTGCFTTFAIHVLLPSPITGPNSICQYGTTTLTNGATGGTWSSSNTFYATVNASGVVTGLTPGSVTISYVMPGCTATMPFFIYDNSACSPCGVFSNRPFTTLRNPTASITASVTGGLYCIPNDVTIAGDVVFTNAIVYIAKDKSINVRPNSSITLEGSHLFSCGGMWKGITLNSDGTQTSRVVLSDNGSGVSTLIEDAAMAISVDHPIKPNGGGPYFIESHDAIFNSNTTGINISNYSPASSVLSDPDQYEFMIKNTVFTSRDLKITGSSLSTSWPDVWPSNSGPGGLKLMVSGASVYESPYNVKNYMMKNCINGVAAFYGVRLDGIGKDRDVTYPSAVIGMPSTFEPSDPFSENKELNIFDGLGYGIYATNANLLVRNSVFENMRYLIDKPSRADPTIGSTGIFTEANDTKKYQLRVEPGVYNHIFDHGQTRSPSIFYDCSIGVYSDDYYRITGLESQMQTRQDVFTDDNRRWYYGYLLRSNAYEQVSINKNRIYNVANGIVMSSTYGEGHYVDVGGGLWMWALGAQYAGDIEINENTISASRSGRVTNEFLSHAIVVENVCNSHVLMGPYSAVGEVHTFNNKIFDAWQGIRIQSYWMQKAKSYGNNITVRLDPNPNWMGYGINHTDCADNYIDNNTVKGSNGDALDKNVHSYYAADNKNLRISCNQAESTGRGYTFFNEQLGTYWRDNNMKYHSEGFMLNNSIIGQQGWPGHAMNNLWGYPAGSEWQTAVYGFPTAYESQIYVATGAFSEPTNNFGLPTDAGYRATTILGGPPVTIHSFVTKPITECNLYSYGDPIPLMRLSSFERTVQQLVSFAGLANPNPRIWQGQYMTWQAVMMDAAMRDTSVVLDNFASRAAFSRMQYLTRIEDELAIGHIPCGTTQCAYPSAAIDSTLAIDSTTGVWIKDDATIDYLIENQKNFYRVYMHFMQGMMDPADSASVDYIAALCPLDYGTVVYKARSLYTVVFNEVREWPDNCVVNTMKDSTVRQRAANNQSTTGTDKVESRHSFLLSPNPATGQITIKDVDSDEGEVQVDISSAEGKSVFRSTVTLEHSTHTISIDKLTPGMYFLQIVDKEGNRYSFKFVKQ